MLLKTQPSEIPLHSVEGSRPIERFEQESGDLFSMTDSNGLASLLSPSTPDETLRRMLSSRQRRSGMNVQEEQTGGLATIQQIRAGITIPSPTADRTVRHSVDNRRPTATGSSSLAVLQETSTPVLLSSNTESALQIPANLRSPSNFVLQTVPSDIFDTQFSFVAALTIIGSLALASNVSSAGLNISSHLSYLLPLLALSLLLPGQHRPSTALIAGAFLLTSSLSGIQDLRTNCTEWLGNEPFSAVAKLLLVATSVSSELLSSLNLSVIAVTAMTHLLGTQDACSSWNGVRVLRGKFSGEREGSYASWLGMMDVLSPVAVV